MNNQVTGEMRLKVLSNFYDSIFDKARSSDKRGGMDIPQKSLIKKLEYTVKLVGHDKEAMTHVNFRHMAFLFLNLSMHHVDEPLENSVKEDMIDTYIRKNKDYGNSFDESLDEFGIVASAVRLSDKVNRLKTLLSGEKQNVSDESILDTIYDGMNYAVMTATYILLDEVSSNLGGMFQSEQELVVKAYNIFISDEEGSDGTITLEGSEILRDKQGNAFMYVGQPATLSTRHMNNGALAEGTLIPVDESAVDRLESQRKK